MSCLLGSHALPASFRAVLVAILIYGGALSSLLNRDALLLWILLDSIEKYRLIMLTQTNVDQVLCIGLARGNGQTVPLLV